jgi:hypothetical protein
VSDEPSVVALAIHAMASRKNHPPMSAAEVVAAIARQQGFAAFQEQLIDLVD